MIRQIIKIDKDKCNGCGICASACHEGAIDLVDGKAHLARLSFCDGMGDCLPGCPQNAISFIEEDVPEYDAEAVKKRKEEKRIRITPDSLRILGKRNSSLSNFPVQLKLTPVTSDALSECDLLIAADCTAYAYRDIHEDFIKGRVTLIGCPKLDAVDYSDKLSEVFKYNDIRSITLLLMTVPCCKGLLRMVNEAILKSGKNIPLGVTTISTDGRISK